ncbi:brain-enriched guanylate kinase-associated protein isoform X2 [Ictidomys tridecemlineatus]
MLSGPGSLARGPHPTSPRQDGHGPPGGPRVEAPIKEAHREALGSLQQSPHPGHSPESAASHPGCPAQPSQQKARGSPGPLPTPTTQSTGSGVAAGPLARLGRRREARLPFSRFLDEVAVRVLDPGTLEAFRGPRGRGAAPSPEAQGSGLAQEPLAGTATPEEEEAAPSPQPSSEATAAAVRGVGPGQAEETRGPCVDSDEHGGPSASPWRPPGPASAADMEKLRLRSPWVPSCLGQPRVLQGRLTRSSPSLWDSALQEQKGELRKRLSYTTHKLEKLETEFDSTRHYLEIELRRAQEELEKVTEKLRRIQSNYLALQRINQELEGKLYRMGQHYEEEKRALSHEIVALNSHLLEAKVTIDKLSEDNELYRKDCNLAAQLLQCSQTYGRAHKVSELPSDFQERVSLHMEKLGCSLPSQLCHPAYADSVPTCVIAKVLEKPDPASLSSHLSDASARDLAFRDGVEKQAPRPPYKGDIYCSDTALYCPEERRRDRRPSEDAPVTDVGFLRAQNSTDSAAEEEEEAEAAAFPAGFRREAFPGYAGSLPTSSSYSSFSATSEEKEHAQASTLTASQQAIYLNSRDELFNRKPPAATYEGSPRFAKAAAAAAAPLEAEVAPGFRRTVSPYPAESFRFPATPGPQQALMPPNLWSLRAKPGSARLPGEDIRGQWRPLSVEDIGAYSYPTSTAGRASPCSFSERYYGGSGGSPGQKAEGHASPLYATYKADSFSEGDDLSQGHLAEPCFLRAGGDLSLSPSRSADPLPGYAPSEGDRDRLGVQLCGAGSSPEPEHGSRDSLEPSSMEASPEMHPAARLSPQQAFPRTGGSGLSRKDSLTKAQLYGTLLN